MFPINSDESQDAEKRFKKLTADMPAAAVAVIRALQPYHRGTDYQTDPLWQLNALSNIDKHQVPVARANVGELYLEPAGGYTQHDLPTGRNSADH